MLQARRRAVAAVTRTGVAEAPGDIPKRLHDRGLRVAEEVPSDRLEIAGPPPGSFLNAAGTASAVSAVPPAEVMNLRRLNSIVIEISNLEAAASLASATPIWLHADA